MVSTGEASPCRRAGTPSPSASRSGPSRPAFASTSSTRPAPCPRRSTTLALAPLGARGAAAATRSRSGRRSAGAAPTRSRSTGILGHERHHRAPFPLALGRRASRATGTGRRAGGPGDRAELRRRPRACGRSTAGAGSRSASRRRTLEHGERVASRGRRSASTSRRVGRLRGDITLRDLTGRRRQRRRDGGRSTSTSSIAAVLGRRRLRRRGHRERAGFYAGIALRGFREPGLRLPPYVVKVRIDATPGVRGHTRLLETALAPRRRSGRRRRRPRSSAPSRRARSPTPRRSATRIRVLRARGKKVLCHLEDAGGKLALRVLAGRPHRHEPGRRPPLLGPLVDSTCTSAALLKKLGVRAEFVRIGAHKLARRAVHASRTRRDVARADHQDLVRPARGRLPARRRRRPEDPGRPSSRSGIAQGAVHRAARRADAGLVDALAYDDELERVVDETMGGRAPRRRRRADDEAPDALGRRAEDRASSTSTATWSTARARTCRSSASSSPARTPIARALKRAREDSSVEAVVFRIETGGGSSLAADVILREAILTAQAKPLIVSMGSTAASGGYYAAVAGGDDLRQPLDGHGLDRHLLRQGRRRSGCSASSACSIETFRKTTPRADAESLFRAVHRRGARASSG